MCSGTFRSHLQPSKPTFRKVLLPQIAGLKNHDVLPPDGRFSQQHPSIWDLWELNTRKASVQFSRSVVSDSCNPMNRSTPGLPVHHQLLEFTQTHVHRVGDATQPSHPLSSPSPPAPNPSQHQSLFQSVNSLHEVAKILEFQLQHHSLQRNPRADLLQNGLVGSPCSPRILLYKV